MDERDYIAMNKDVQGTDTGTSFQMRSFLIGIVCGIMIGLWLALITVITCQC